MRDTSWIRVATIDSIPPREGRPVSLGGRDLAIFNLGGRFVAIENRCPHQGGPLADGIVSGTTVVCPLHAWRVRLDSGGIERPGGVSACVRTFRTRVEGNILMVQLPAAADTPDGAERAA